jgi:hypothetical protein
MGGAIAGRRVADFLEVPVSTLRRLLIAATAGVSVLALTSVPASAEATLPVAIWEMNEAPGTLVMTDSGPNAQHGSIGSEVLTGFTYEDGTGYDFQWLRPNTPPAHPQHPVVVPDSDHLDPGTRDYAVTLRMRTTSSFGNVFQKGQGGAPGGRYKIEAPKGIIVCAYQGSGGYVEVKSVQPVNDGAWHIVKCERTLKYVTLTIDGVVVATKKGRTGTIANTWPISVGGKTSCDQIKVTCDYFPGEIDRVQIDASA